MLLVTVAVLAMQAAPAGQDGPGLKPLNLQEWITEDDYPARALRNDEEGEVKFKLTVAGDGNVERCEITASSGFADLDAATCALIARRARFSAPRPGMPYHSSVIWQIPPTPPRPIVSAHVAGVIRLSADDKVLGCEERSEGRAASGVYAVCEDLGTELPAGMLEAVGGGGVPRAITVEYVQRFGDDAEPARFYAEPKQTLLGRRLVQFDITESGKVENCRDTPTGQEGIFTPMPSPCTGGLGPFVPPLDATGQPKATTGMVEMAISRAP